MKIAFEGLAAFAFFLILSTLAVAQSGVQLSERDRVMLTVDALRLGLQEGNKQRMLTAFAHEFSIGEVTYSGQSVEQLVDSTLSAVSYRETARDRPPQLPFSGYWDFAMGDFELAFGDDTCVVNCTLKLLAAPKVKNETLTTECVLVFRKIGNSWKLVQATNLFEFLIGQGAK